MKYTYLLIDFCTILVPLIFSFHPRLRFYKSWAAFFPAVVLTGMIFIAWDVYFTQIGVWGFNEQYLLGIRILNLPLEEVLFFLCIPYACVFTYHAFSLVLDNPLAGKVEQSLTVILIIALVSAAIAHPTRIYTVTTFLFLALLLGFASWVFQVSWLGRFYLVYGILLLPFLIVNGLLTGSWLADPVVWYNGRGFMGFRIGTIPVEDIFYGMALILFNLLLYHLFLQKRTLYEKHRRGTGPAGVTDPKTAPQ